ncbi:Anthranilate phosphoribosyltransferase [Octadecabacter temperatus]|uniref:Anthranilate phosphoribosyltransferase n=1 Tax=Octadecabacter temperatus TaxID=1458307 RepID=A0A0K0Y509_9RHOB|nr:glycosyl transferase family protein [Octadecabacter temperatus]AKS46025.1 Anthranilate phosphoribosyltransferase [Octadecabacter temperatus]SIO05935.1 Anthranilate phosphoribosyltransferase [Octadecabacter temperatus]
MTLAPFVRIVARGKGRARPLTQDEAQQAMTLMLSGDAAPEAVGALLMVLRLRGETDAEIAGFTAALRATTPNFPTADLDWPCYAAGRTRGSPLFLLAAKLVAQAGYAVTLHGWNSHQSSAADVREVLYDLELEGDGLTYRPLETLNPAAFELLKLRDTFGLRSCINTVLRMWNPSGAGASVQGVFHPSYRGLQSRAAALLGDRNLTVIKGGGGEFERNPTKETAIFGLRNGEELNTSAPACLSETRRMNEPEQAFDIKSLWRGSSDDTFAIETIIGTAALALWTLDEAATVSQSSALAADMWRDRHSLSRRAG